MNTPSHLILNLALLRRPVAPAMTWPILIGALLPDAALFIFYGWARAQGLSEQIIWGEAYYSEPWQAIFAVGNSIPLGLLGVALGYSFRRSWAGPWIGPWIGFWGASMVLHHLADLPLHHDDAHQHFWPLSSFRFISPVSYYDADHFGLLGATVELVLVLAATACLLPRLNSGFSKGLLGVMALVTIAGYVVLQIRPLI
ncbi:MAG: hypothetical protein ACFCVB_06830 [Nodosilinea sp.]